MDEECSMHGKDEKYIKF